MRSIGARLEAAERRIHSDARPVFALFGGDGQPRNDAARRLAARENNPAAGAFTIRFDRAEDADASE